MNKPTHIPSPQNSPWRLPRQTGGWRRLLPFKTSSAGKLAAGLSLGLAALLPSRADIVVMDNDFNDPNNNVNINTNGVGGPFTVWSSNAGDIWETNSLLQMTSTYNGSHRCSAVSSNQIAISGGGTIIEFRNVSFAQETNVVAATPNTDRLFLGIGNAAAASDFYEAGAASMPSGFYIQIMSDSIATGSGNAGWSGYSALFYKDAAGTRTELYAWALDHLRWTAAGPTNFAPVLNIKFTINATNLTFSITGDTAGGSPITWSGNYADYGLNVDLLNGFNATRVMAFDQTEAPGIRMSIDRVVVTQVGNLVVPAPTFVTPEYGYSTNQVLAGEVVSVSCAVIAGPNAVLQWQKEDAPYSGTYSDIPGANSTNLVINTSALGDYQPRNFRLKATDGAVSITSSSATLTVAMASPPYVVQDTTPVGPSSVYQGLSFEFRAAFNGNLPIGLQWQKSTDNVTWSDLSNMTNKTLIVTNLAAGNAGYYRCFASNLVGTLPSSSSQLIVASGAAKFTWGPPVGWGGQTAEQILTNLPGKIAGAVSSRTTSSTVALANSNSIVFAPRNSWVSFAGGNGFNNNAAVPTTGNGNFNTILNNYYYDGTNQTFTLSGLVPGKQYAVQVFAHDNRAGMSGRLVNWVDPADPLDVSVTYSMSDLAYVVGTFTASSTTEKIQEYQLIGAGNFNCLVLRALGWDPPPYFVTVPVTIGNYLGAAAALTGSAVCDTNVANPTITYQWQAGPTGGPYTNLVEGAKYVGVTTTSLTINNLTADDGALAYVQVASNSGGSTTSRESRVNVAPVPPHNLLGSWLSGNQDFKDAAGYQPAGTHDGLLIGTNGTAGPFGYYFTNDVPPGASGSSLYLAGGTAIIIPNTATNLASFDTAYTNTFDDTISNRFTVMCWAKGWPGNWNPFVAKRGETTGANQGGFQLRRNADTPSHECFTIRGSAGTDDQASSFNGNDGKWHHYVGTWDSLTGLRTIYADGKQVGQITGDTGSMQLPAGTHLVLGGRESGTPADISTVTMDGAYFTGSLYDVRIYNYALSPAEIGAIGKLAPQPLATQRDGANRLVLSWPYGTLVESTNLFGPWTPSTNTSPFTLNPDGTVAEKFFRVRNP